MTPKKKTPEKTRVLALRARNVKCVREVAIDHIGDIHEIRGDSGQGKTTLLDAIRGALEGLAPEMVTLGEDAAEIELRLSNATINRIIPREGKETLLVKDAGGSPVEKAKDFLATICGPTAFNPIAWVRLGGGEQRGKTERLRRQRDQLLEALPLSLTAADVAQAVRDLGPEHAEALSEVNLDGVEFEQHALLVCAALERACYDYRAAQNTRAEDAEARLTLIPAPAKAAPAEDADTLRKRLDEATQAFHRAAGSAANFATMRKRADELRARVEAEARNLQDGEALSAALIEAEAELSDANAEVETLREKLRQAEQRKAAIVQRLDEQRKAMQAIEAHQNLREQLAEIETTLAGQTEQDTDALKAVMDNAAEMLKRREAQDAHDRAAHAAQEARANAERYTALVKLFRDDLPKQVLASADLPVEGLGIEGDTITINAVPLHQLGTSDQIRVGVLIASALNPGSAFVLVDGAESMGSSDRLALANAAQELGLQLIMTFVDEDAQPAEGVTVMRKGEAVKAA